MARSPAEIVLEGDTKKSSLISDCADVTQQRVCIYERVSSWITLIGLQVKKLLLNIVQGNRRLTENVVDLQVTDLSVCLMRHGAANPETRRWPSIDGVRSYIELPTQEGYALECTWLVRGYGLTARFRP